jgi:hypothetical protein
MSLAEGRTRACIICFEKKLKCNRQDPCLNCIKRKLSCVYSHVEKPRKTPQRNAKRIKEMETRLAAMEDLLRNTVDSDSQQSSNSLPIERSTPGLGPLNEQRQNQLEEPDVDFLSADSEMGPSSSRLRLIKHQGSSKKFVKWPLPSVVEASSVLQEYFQSFNSIFPLFDEREFMERMNYDYDMEPLANVGWWAAINVALAIGYRMRGMRTLQAREFNVKSYGYMQNALNITQDLVLRKSDLLSVQALLGIAIVLQETPNSRPASIIVAAAVKLSQELGLHRQRGMLGLSEQQMEQCKRVFWIGYMLDKDFSLQLNQPPVQTDLECNVSLPSEAPIDGLGIVALTNGQDVINLFRLRVQLAVIQSETYATLYSLQSSNLSTSARELAIENLDNRLADWKGSIGLDLGPDSLLTSVTPGAIVHIVILYMNYFNCLTMIHSVSFRGDYWSASTFNTIEQTLAGDPVSSRRTLCLPAARLAVRLVNLIPRGDYACIWLLLHYYITAVVILLAKIINHPQDQSAATDMALVGPLLRLLESLSVGDSMEGGDDLNNLQDFSLGLERKARIALENVQLALIKAGELLIYPLMSPELQS